MTNAMRDLGWPVDIYLSCVGSSERIGVWFSAVPFDDLQSRANDVTLINLLAPGETFAMHIDANFIRRLVLSLWRKSPKRRGGDGAPDQNGPTHLTDFSYNIGAANRITTNIKGFDERPWPDADFTLNIADMLSTSGGRLRIQSVQSLDVDWSILDLLTLLSWLAGLSLPTLLPLGAIFLSERIYIGSQDTPDVGGGVGQIIGGLVPRRIVLPPFQLPGTSLIRYADFVPDYSRLEITGPAGVTIGGTYDLIERQPLVAIFGPTEIFVYRVGSEPLSIVRDFRWSAGNMQPPVTATWTTSGTIAEVSGNTATLSFEISDLDPGQEFDVWAAVEATDSTGRRAWQSQTVRIRARGRT